MDQPRDKHGHFAPKQKTETILRDTTKVSKTNDDSTLVDVHVNNPLRKITQLLEDIKKQKAFSFTLKGSLGIMGVALALSVLGVFGTTHALCDKGIQTQAGRLIALNMRDIDDTSWWSKAVSFLTGAYTVPSNYRVILYTPKYDAIHLVASGNMNVSQFVGKQVFVTGNYDSCSQEMNVSNENNIQLF